jgi:hypothetical protein
LLFAYHFIGVPTVVIRDFALFPIVGFKIEVLDQQFFTIGAVLKAVYPLITVFKVISPRPDGSFQRFGDTPLNLFGYPGVRFVFTGAYETQTLVEHRLAPFGKRTAKSRGGNSSDTTERPGLVCRAAAFVKSLARLRDAKSACFFNVRPARD